jgi:hypothetical protein
MLSSITSTAPSVRASNTTTRASTRWRVGGPNTVRG